MYKPLAPETGLRHHLSSFYIKSPRQAGKTRQLGEQKKDGTTRCTREIWDNQIGNKVTGQLSGEHKDWTHVHSVEKVTHRIGWKIFGELLLTLCATGS